MGFQSLGIKKVTTEMSQIGSGSLSSASVISRNFYFSHIKKKKNLDVFSSLLVGLPHLGYVLKENIVNHSLFISSA